VGTAHPAAAYSLVPIVVEQTTEGTVMDGPLGLILKSPLGSQPVYAVPGGLKVTYRFRISFSRSIL
jgi:hypothetical protein